MTEKLGFMTPSNQAIVTSVPIAQAVLPWLHPDTEVLPISLKDRADDIEYEQVATHPTSREQWMVQNTATCHLPTSRHRGAERLVCFSPDGPSRFSLPRGS